MSALNGDRARFRINQVRKLRRRQRIQALVAGLKAHTTDGRKGTIAPTDSASGAAARTMQKEGGPTRTGN